MRTFRTALYAAARAGGVRVVSVSACEYPASFVTATVSDSTRGDVVLCHVHVPLVAFVSSAEESLTDRFRDPPEWAAAFAHSGFTVVSASDMNAPIVSADTSALLPVERKEIQYWRPETIGEAVFNTWD